jgi:hypothetical protein
VNFASEIDAVNAVEREVHQEDVRLSGLESVEEFFRRSGFAADFEVALFREEAPKSRPKNGVVVYDKNPLL